MAQAHLRHQSSLQGLLDFSVSEVLTLQQHDQAELIFNRMVSEYEPLQEGRRPYEYITLLRTMYESVECKDKFLHHFISFIDADLQNEQAATDPDFSEVLSRVHMSHQLSAEPSEELQETLANFADHLMNDLFLPLKAAGLRTPQPSPAAPSPINTSGPFIGTKQRLTDLRQQCLIRDRYRCVISRSFDATEAHARRKKYGNDAKDQDGNSLASDTPTPLEVAHILPHSLMSVSDDSDNLQLTASKQLALQILAMFDAQILHLIEGEAIDQPTNAIMLTPHWHDEFGSFWVSFQPSANGLRHSYNIDDIETDFLFRRPSILPIERQLYVTPNKTIDPPSPRLLAIHHAIANILSLSRAGEYADEILEDMDELNVKEDGSTALGEYIRLKMDGWLKGVPVC